MGARRKTRRRFKKAKRLILRQGLTRVEACRRAGLSTSTFYRLGGASISRDDSGHASKFPAVGPESVEPPDRAYETAVRDAVFHHRGSLTAEQIEHDAMLCAALGAVARAHPGGHVTGPGRKPSSPEVPLGRYVFTGGTALLVAHGVTDRYSQDIDLLYLPIDAEQSRHRHTKARKIILKSAASALGGDLAYGHMGMAILQARIGHGDDPEYLAVDIAHKPELLECEGMLDIESKEVRSLIGRVSGATAPADDPRFGGFEVPTVGLPYIAATKLDAQHHRAMAGRCDQITERARDLYDLWCIAVSPQADRVRATVPALSEVTVRDVINQGRWPRPSSGYGNSPVFRPGTDANEALRAGYEQMRPDIFGDAPAFVEAVEAARSLDA